MKESFLKERAIKKGAYSQYSGATFWVAGWNINVLGWKACVGLAAIVLVRAGYKNLARDLPRQCTAWSSLP